MGTIESSLYKNKNLEHWPFIPRLPLLLIMKDNHIHKLKDKNENNNKNNYSYFNINKKWWEWLRN